MEKGKILFVVPDGVGIRNYLHSDLLEQLKESEVVLLSTLPKDAFQQIESDFSYYPLVFSKENVISRILREAATFARLHHNAKKVSNPSILKNWNEAPKGYKLKLLSKAAQIIGKIASENYNSILSLEKISRKKWGKKKILFYRKQLLEIKPTSIFITHQRVASLMPICLAAKQLNIPVIAAIYSWDNLPKGRLAIQADHYIVWSDYMKQEMTVYYPEIDSEKVMVLGTPQFEFYLEKGFAETRENFAIEYGLQPDKKWICFSGDDVKTSPFDPQYLADVADAITKMKESQRPQLIFRRCPVDFSTRYDAVLKKYQNIIIPIDPIWNVPSKDENWGAFFPKKEDIKLQVNLAKHCEFVINLGSTMAHDFAMFDKPCFYINYDIVADNEWSVNTIYKFQHFKSMDGLDAVGWLDSATEIQEKIEFALNNASNLAKDRKKWLEKIVKHPVDKASVEIANLLKRNNDKN